LDSFPNRVFTGNVNFISSMLNPQTRTMDVQAEVTNPQLSLKPNMFARMSILIGKHSVLAVPLSAVEQIGDFNFVFVEISPKVFEPRRVTLGQQNEQFAEVLNGVKEGEQIAYQGTMGLKGIALKSASDTGD
jgi:multidrug efflux pump subunit AcrA (membrane-fusion protein)